MFDLALGKVTYPTGVPMLEDDLWLSIRDHCQSLI